MTNEEFIKHISLENEEWRDVIGFEGLYMASSLGRIMSLSKYVNNRFKDVYKEPRLLTPTKNKGGNLSIILSKDGKGYNKHISSLIAYIFLPNPNNYPVLKHLDGDISNNDVINLEWNPIKIRKKQYDTSSLPNERWIDVTGYEGLYTVSSCGRVMSIKSNKILKPYSTGDYLQVTLVKDSIKTKHYVHRLVASHYIPNPNDYPCIDHIDTEKSNNHVENLRWCTYTQNSNNPITYKRVKEAFYNGNNWQAKPIVQLKGEQLIAKFNSARKASFLGFNKNSIARCCHNKNKTHKGYRFMYLSDYEKLVNKSKNDLSIPIDNI